MSFSFVSLGTWATVEKRKRIVPHGSRRAVIKWECAVHLILNITRQAGIHNSLSRRRRASHEVDEIQRLSRRTDKTTAPTFKQRHKLLFSLAHLPLKGFVHASLCHEFISLFVSLPFSFHCLFISLSSEDCHQPVTHYLCK